MGLVKVAQLEIDLLANVARLQNDMNRATRTVDGAMQRISRATAMAMKAIGGLAAAFSARAIYQQIRNITTLASRYNELGIVMNTVGRNAGYTRPHLDSLEKSLKATGISAIESRSNIAKLISANIDLSKATELARLAQDAAVIGGMNSSDAFARLTSGIQSAQVETLRTMGLNANFQKSYEELADQLGKNTKDLTELEKTQARTNAVLALAPTIAGAYEASMDNAGKQMRSTQRYVEDLGVALGQAFQPAYELAVSAYTKVLKTAADEVDTLKRAMTALSLSIIPLMVAGLTKLAITVIPILTARMWSLTAAMLSNPMTAIPTLVSMAIAAFVMFDEKTEVTRDAFSKFGQVWQEIFADAKKVTDELKQEVANLWGGIKDLTGDTSPKTWTDALIVGLARVADVAALVVRSIGTVIFAFNAALADVKVGLAWLGRPDALTKMANPTRAAELEAEYQQALANRKAEVDRFNESLDALVNGPLNKYEQAALRAVNTIRVVSDEVVLVDLTLENLTETTTKNTKATSAAAKAAEAFAKAREDGYTAHRNEISNLHEQAQALEDQVKVFGRGERALERLGIARLKEQRAMLAGFAGSEEQIELIELEIAARERLVAAGMSMDRLEEEKAANDLMLADWKQTVGEYDRVFRDGFADMLNNGRTGWKSFTRSLVTTFKTSVADQIYKMFAQPFVMNIVASVIGIGGTGGAAQAAGALGGAGGVGGSTGGIINMVSTARNLFSTIKTGFAGISSSIAGWTQSAMNFMSGSGGFVGQGPMQISGFAKGVGAAGSYLSGAAIGYTAGKLISGDYSLFKNDSGNTANIGGVVIGSILGGPIGGAIGGAIGGIINRAFGMGRVENRGTTVDGALGAHGLSAQATTQFRQKGGWFRSTKRWSNSAPVETSGATRAFFEIRDAVGDMVEALGASSRAMNSYRRSFSVSAENFEDHIRSLLSTVADDLILLAIPNIQSLAREGETMVVTLDRLITTLSGVNVLLDAMDQRAFAVSVSGASAAASLADLFGGLDAMRSATESFYMAVYTEQERAQRSLDGVSSALRVMRMSVPRTAAELRDMTQALNLNTEAGRQAYAVLVSVGPELLAAIDAIAQATDEAAQELSEKLLNAYTGRGAMMAALDVATLKTALLGDTLTSTYKSAGNISTLFLDVNSGLISFGSATSGVGGRMTNAQRAARMLADQMHSLQIDADGATIDVKGLSMALSSVNTEGFVHTIVGVFEVLANRITGVIGAIANERVAVREAAIGILNPTVMTKGAIQAGISSINTALPADASAVNAQAQLTQAIARQDAAENERRQIQNTYGPRVTAAQLAYNQSRSQSNAYLQQYKNILTGVQKWSSYGETQENFGAGTRFRAYNYYTNLESGQTAANNAAYSNYSRHFNAAQARAKELATLSAQLDSRLAANKAVLDAATSTTEAAAEAARAAALEYADALQNFAIDAGKSVTRLSKLREETVKYYEAQKALAALMGRSAEGLRTTVDAYRQSQMTPEQQFNIMQAEYAKNYAMALSTNGEELAGYGDKMNAGLNQMLEVARQVYGDAQYQSFANTAIARAEAIAERLETLAPQNYEADSLELLGQIDSTLAALDASARSAEQLIVNAINGGRDATVAGLRQVINAITGNPVAAFASGGIHAGGLRIVGERGPELEVTGPSRIYSASQTRALLSGAGSDNSATVAELRELRRELSELRTEARATATNTSKLARHAFRAEVDGQLIRTDADAPIAVEVAL